jgi:hypothetical protein
VGDLDADFGFGFGFVAGFAGLAGKITVVYWAPILRISGI